MPPKSRLSTKAQVGLCLGVLLFFAVVLTIVGFAASSQTRQKITAFATDGATVTGTVSNKYIHSASRNWVYWLDVSFKAKDGKYYYQSANVPNTIWYGLRTNGPVQVTYSRSRPEWFYVADDAPTERDIAIFEGMYRYGMIAALLLLIALGVFLTWNRPRKPEADAPKVEAPVLPPRTQPRTGFGTRQRV